jgi:hypothetical protein
MSNLLHRAKPELVAAIASEKDQYPRLTEELIESLTTECFVRNLRYHAILALEQMIREYKIPMKFGPCVFDLFYDIDDLFKLEEV